MIIKLSHIEQINKLTLWGLENTMKGSHKVSILQGTEKRCYITGATKNLEKHHIYYGSHMRSVSDRNGFWVWLIPEYHRGTKGVHGRDGHVLDAYLKHECQKAYEKEHSHEQFMELVKKNYLMGDDENG